MLFGHLLESNDTKIILKTTAGHDRQVGRKVVITMQEVRLELSVEMREDALFTSIRSIVWPDDRRWFDCSRTYLTLIGYGAKQECMNN